MWTRFWFFLIVLCPAWAFAAPAVLSPTCNEVAKAGRAQPDEQEITQWVLEYQKSLNPALRNRIVLESQPILKSLAFEYRRNPYHAQEDLISIGNLLTFMAIDRFKNSPVYSSFSHYLRTFLRSRFIDLIKGKTLPVPGTGRTHRETTASKAEDLEWLAGVGETTTEKPFFVDPIFAGVLANLQSFFDISATDQGILNDLLGDQFDKDVEYARQQGLNRITYASRKMRFFETLRNFIGEHYPNAEQPPAQKRRTERTTKKDAATSTSDGSPNPPEQSAANK